MKKWICLIMVLCLAMGMTSAFAAGAGVSARLIMKLATRTGPATRYDEQGTHFIKNYSSTWVSVLSKAWDDPNNIWWVQVEYTSGGKLYRSYTGLKRVDVAISQIPEEQLRGSDRMRVSADGLWGPGTQYARSRYDVPANTNVSVYDWENGYVQVEFYDSRTSSYRRAWVPDSSLASGGWSWIGSGSSSSVSGALATGTYGLNGSAGDTVWISSVKGNSITFSLTFDAIAWIDGIDAATSDAEYGIYRFAHNAGGLGTLYGYLETEGDGWVHLVIEYCTNSGFSYVLEQEGYDDSYYVYLNSGAPIRSYPDGN